MKDIINVRIYAKQVESGSQKFIACSATINDIYCKIKFKQECEKAPKKSGVYDVKLNLNKCSTQIQNYTKKDGTKGKTVIIWVSEIDNITKLTDEELAEIQRENFNEIFDKKSNQTNDEELPF